MTHNKVDIVLRPTTNEDLDTLFEFQVDEESGYMAAFMPANHRDKSAYLDKYRKLLADTSVNNVTIWYKDAIVGSMAKFVMDGKSEITYWIDKHFWGKGIATNALASFLEKELARPLLGRVAFDNLGSQKVLLKNGFKKIGTDRGYASARQKEIEEYIYVLEG